MIDTAGTITLAAQALQDAGALDVYACCTHVAVLSGPAMDRINNSVIKELIVTDSINIPAEKVSDKIVMVSVSQLIAEAIKRIHENPGRCLSPSTPVAEEFGGSVCDTQRAVRVPEFTGVVRRVCRRMPSVVLVEHLTVEVDTDVAIPLRPPPWSL